MQHGSQTGPSGHRTVGGRSFPQRAQTAVARGVHDTQTGALVPAKLHSFVFPQTLHVAAGIL
jgi:hypothetical protein